MMSLIILLVTSHPAGHMPPSSSLSMSASVTSVTFVASQAFWYSSFVSSIRCLLDMRLYSSVAFLSCISIMKSRTAFCASTFHLAASAMAVSTGAFSLSVNACNAFVMSHFLTLMSFAMFAIASAIFIPVSDRNCIALAMLLPNFEIASSWIHWMVESDIVSPDCPARAADAFA